MKLFEEFKLYENMWDTNNTDCLHEAIPSNQLSQIAGNLLFNNRKNILYGSTKGKRPVACPGVVNGCDKSFLKADDYNAHIVNCDKARKHFNYPARVKNKKVKRKLDIMDNITAGALLNYLEQYTNCELCGATLTMKERRPDHYHLELHGDGAGSGHFRGVLCDRCNTFIGTLESLLIDYGIDIDKITKYLAR